GDAARPVPGARLLGGVRAQGHGLPDGIRQAGARRAGRGEERDVRAGARRGRRQRQEVLAGSRQDHPMPQPALREILATAGVRGDVDFQGDDPVLPIRYRVGAAGAAALGALGLAAAGLSGMPQRVSVNTRAAAVSLRSAFYLRINGEPPPPVWDPMSGFYPVR